ncbi:MAG: pilin glycosylation ligase domain-containing protein, partial [Luteimonas sp.]|nr:pilin glycosylation ligase domain-containing protein [Luteimonas sp.]
MQPFPRESASPTGISVLLASLALAVPTLLAFNLPPSSTFLNQASTLVGWGAWLLTLSGGVVDKDHPRGLNGLIALQTSLALLLLAALTSPPWSDLPWSLSLSAAALIAAAALAAQTATRVSQGSHALPTFRAFCIGMVVAGALSSLVGLVQVFAPTWADGTFIARSYIEGRAVGNMRQPNHLSSLLLWAIVAAVWLGEARVIKRWGSTLLVLLFLFVVVLSASRTGALSMVLLLVWGVLDKRLSRHARVLLVLSPVVYALFWYGTGVWADATQHVFGGETRFSTKGDVSSSRLGIWSNALALIRMHPWAGVGFGEFNFAWTLTPFPDRPVAFFDHTHNIVLQFLVELGIPLGLLVLGLLFYALVQAFRGALRPVAAEAAPGEALLRPAAFAMVLLIVVHSLLEYPLWYAYFLLPAAFAFGLCLAPAEGVPPVPPMP